MLVVYFDLETTAAPGDDARDAEKAIPVQAALGYYDTATDKADPLVGFPLLINPGVPISADSAAIHGLTDADVANAPALPDALELIASHIASAVHNGIPITGMNLAYDFTVLDRQLRAHRLATLGCRPPEGPLMLTNAPRPTHDPDMIVMDVSVIERWGDKDRPGKRKLIDLCERYGIPLTNAHDANADAVASARLLGALIDTARTCAHMQNSGSRFGRNPLITVPPHLAGHRPELQITITTPERFAALAAMNASELMTGQATWYTEFVDFVTKGQRPSHDVWPVRQLPPVTHKPEPKTFTCAACSRRRDSTERRESVIGTGYVCQECWDDTL